MTEAVVPGVLGIDHVGVAVPDLRAAIAFYRETLGFVLAHEEVNEEQGVHEAMMRAAGDDGTGVAVQLLAPLTPESTIAKFIDKRGPGMQQLAYRVADIEATCDSLRAKGLQVLWDKPKHGTADSRVNFVHPRDTGGVLVELVEPAAR